MHIKGEIRIEVKLASHSFSVCIAATAVCVRCW